MVVFNKKYFLLFLAILVVEIFIALFIRDSFVRPYLGDVLVVMLLYCFIKAFYNLKVKFAAGLVLLFAYFVEFLQYVQITKILDLQSQKITTTMLGTHFEWLDILAYTAGVVVIILIERGRG